MAAFVRKKVIAIEKGDLSVRMMAYARVSAAMPTLDDIHGVFD